VIFEIGFYSFKIIHLSSTRTTLDEKIGYFSPVFFTNLKIKVVLFKNKKFI